jgi:hypothetical protein
VPILTWNDFHYGASCIVMDRHAIEACLPPRLHSFSRMVLNLYLDGRMETAEFRRWFHMPNWSIPITPPRPGCRRA